MSNNDQGSMNTKLQWSQTTNEDSAQSFTIFEGEPPDFELREGTTLCRECGALIASPKNVIPASFLEAHQGHVITAYLAEFPQCGPVTHTWDDLRSLTK